MGRRKERRGLKKEDGEKEGETGKKEGGKIKGHREAVCTEQYSLAGWR